MGIILMLGLVSVLLGNPALSTSPRFTPVDELHHIHGLAVDPGDPAILYVATHGGLVRLVDGERWEYVGESRSDLMGFTVHPSEHGLMYVSGHPDHVSQLPNPIGVMVSRDAGQSWQPLALAGKVDLHAMTISADGQTLYGWNVTGSSGLYRISARDGTWARVDATGLRDVFSLDAHPKHPGTLIAGTRGGLLMTKDGGQTWSSLSETLSGIAVTAVAYHPKDPRVVYAYAARPDFGLIRSDDDGQRWKSFGFYLGKKDAANVFAISPYEPETIYLSTFASDLYESKDEGQHWKRLVKQGRPVKP